MLMPNHVHPILVPSDQDGPPAGIGTAHRRHAGHIHAGSGAAAISGMGAPAASRWMRSISGRRCAMSRSIRRAGLVERAFAAVLAAGEDEAASMRLRRAEQIGRPLDGRDFLDRLEREGRWPLAPTKRGRKPAKSALPP
ncbi:hypothetical protein [Inquilinus limosus]|uniref:hypothetical protein n=1 Tax=Inquilinus limosus TaxID=171674 RepID=UPI001B7F9905|nr:hypothetical protein [Inquilinus limosus]